MVLRWVPLLAAVLSPSIASAQIRADTLRMRCAEGRALVSQAGSVVLGTGPNLYDRFVAGGGFCPVTQFAEAAFVRSADTPQCLIGYRCREIDIHHR